MDQPTLFDALPIGGHPPVKRPRIDPYTRYEVDANGCWIWQGFINWLGYGTYSTGNGSTPAHRLLYQHHIGPIPPGLDLDHLCNQRSCVNPSHLEPVTRAENMRRSRQRRGLDTHCANGHERNEVNTYTSPTTGSQSCRACQRERARRRITESRAASVSG